MEDLLSNKRHPSSLNKLPRVITVANQKGGVGKTTTVVNIATCLAETGKRVLIVDFDPQANATSAVGIEPGTFTHSIYEVILGQVLTAGSGQNPARQASINAGVPISKPAHIVNQVCGSGLRAIISGYQSIILGDSKIVIAGGQENMSKAPHSIFYRDTKKFNEKNFIILCVLTASSFVFRNYMDHSNFWTFYKFFEGQGSACY